MELQILRKMKYRVERYRFRSLYLKQTNSDKSKNLIAKHYRKKDIVRSALFSIQIIDVLDNNGMNKAVKKLAKLKSKSNIGEFMLTRKHKRVGKYNYIHANTFGTFTGILCSFDIKDGAIRSVSVTYTPLNNSQILLVYEFWFNQAIWDEEQLVKVTEQYIEDIPLLPYFFVYADKKIIRNPMNWRDLLRLDQYMFQDTLQGLIAKYSYTQIGRNYPLPIVWNEKIKRFNNKVKKRLQKPFLAHAYQNKKHASFLHINNCLNRCVLTNICTGRYRHSLDVDKLFSEHGLELYYSIFSEIEDSEIKNRFIPYLHGTKRRIKRSDLKWLIDRMRNLRERRDMIASINESPDTIEWIACQPEIKFNTYPYWTDKFEKTYEDYFEYSKAINSIQTDRLVLVVAAATLIATLVGIIVTILVKIAFG